MCTLVEFYYQMNVTKKKEIKSKFKGFKKEKKKDINKINE